MSKNIVRVNKTKNYTVMSNIHLRDVNLSWKAKGIHSYVLSLPDDWKIILTHLKTMATDGDKSMRSGLQELYDLHYWQKYPVYVDGIITHWVTEIYEEPFDPAQKIKNIIIRNNEETVNYVSDNINVKIIDNKLLSQKGEVGKGKQNTSVDLLSQKGEVDTIEEGMVEIETDRLLSTYNTKDLFVTNQSFNQSEKKENERVNEDINTDKEFQNILNNIEIYEFGINAPAVEQSLRLLYYADKPMLNNGILVPPNTVRDDLRRLKWGHVDLAIRDLQNASETQKIRNISSYLARCIYNSIFNSNLKLEAEINYNGY